MWKIVAMMVVGVGVAGMAGCQAPHVLTQPTGAERARFGADLLPPEQVPAPVPATMPVGTLGPISSGAGAGAGGLVPVAGTWTFTTPSTVTRVSKTTSDYSQYSLFMGRPEPTDTPFVVITVGRENRVLSESEPAYKVAEKRTYTLNGNSAREWTGNTESGAGFCELLLTRGGGAGGTGDTCHVMAPARNEEERKVALEVLGSVVWGR